MGLRFHKSITIAKGVRVNISKSGASLSVGKKGASVNIGKNGLYGNLGLPGTGLSYRKKLVDNPLKAKKKSNKSVGEFHVEMDEKGNITLLDGKEKVIKDEAKIRAIKATDEFKEEKERLNKARLENLDALLEEKQAENDAFIQIGKLSAEVKNQKGFDGLSLNDEEALYNNIDSFIGDLSLPVEIFVSYEYKDGCLYVDLDLPEIEDLPKEEYVQMANGSIKEKAKTQTTLKEEYIQTVFGIAVFLASNFFNLSLLFDKVLISAFTQRRNKEGDIQNEYIYSLKFDRSQFVGVDFKEEDPYSFCMKFDNRCNISASNVMKQVKPFDEY